MSAFPLTRRAALGILALSPAVGVRSALAQPNARFRNIVVDVSPLRASMGDPTAAWVQQELPGALAQALAGYMAAPGDRYGATLVARIDDLYLGPSSGGTGPWGAAQDTINGTLLVKGPHGGTPPARPFVQPPGTTRWPSTSLCASSPTIGGLWLWRRRSRAGRRESSGSSSEASPSGPAPC